MAPWAMYPPMPYGYQPFPFVPPAPFTPQSIQAPTPAQIEALPDNYGPASGTPSGRWPDGNGLIDCLSTELPDDWDDQGWSWRSSGARKKDLPTDAYRINKNNCLGVFRCQCKDSKGNFSRFVCPKKDKGPREAQQNDRCTLCQANLVLIPCTATLTVYHYEDDNGAEHVVKKHDGFHAHPRPPVPRLTAAEREELDVQVRYNPTQTAQQLRIGAELGQTSIGAINTALYNSRKARAEVEKSRIRNGLAVPSRARQAGFDLVDTVGSLDGMFETTFIVKAELLTGQYIVMQTPFMRDVLLRDQITSWKHEIFEVETGRHGLPTDGSHDMFKRGVLLSSLAYSPVLFRWCSVLYTWIGRLDAAHHAEHYKHVMISVAEVCSQVLHQEFDPQLLSQVVDFSKAQRNGFLDAFVTFMTLRNPGWHSLSNEAREAEKETVRKQGKALLKGCVVHWKRSVHKIRQVIGSRHTYRFDNLIRTLKGSQTSPEEFTHAVDSIRLEFPEIRPWLSWWTQDANASMIFPCVSKMPAELRARIPDSTNAVESSHWALYRGAGTKHDLLEGIRRVYVYQRETEKLYEAVLAGHVDPKFAGARPERISHIDWHENDGRAPDTRARLEMVETLEAEAAAKYAKMTTEQRFEASNSSPASAVQKIQILQAPQGPSELDLQSYEWDRNSCFQDASLEALFRAFRLLSNDDRQSFMKLLFTEAPDSSLYDIFDHFRTRGIASGFFKTFAGELKPDLHHLKAALYFGQSRAKRWLQKLWDGAPDADGSLGCSRTWVNQMVRIATTFNIQSYFGVSYELEFTCDAANKSHERTVFIQPMLELVLRKDDIVIGTRSWSGSGSPSLSHHISRMTLYDPLKPSDPLHNSATQRCSVQNHCKAAPTSITSVFPLFLRVVLDPLVQTSQNGSFDWRGVHCMMPNFDRTLHIGSISYELAAVVRYEEGEVGHFTTSTVIGPTAFVYDDTKQKGLLQAVGPASEIERYDPRAVYLMYTRTSAESRYKRSCAEIAADFNLRPSVDTGENPASLIDRTPSRGVEEMPEWFHEEHSNNGWDSCSEADLNYLLNNPDSDFAPQTCTASDGDVDEMILATLDKESHRQNRPIFTPEMDLPPITAFRSSRDEVADSVLEGSIYLPPRGSPANSDGPLHLRCDGCKEEVDDADESTRAGTAVTECEHCRRWSHIECLDPTVDWESDDTHFICTHCQYPPIGTIIPAPFPDPTDPLIPDSKFYPAVILKRCVDRKWEDDEYELRCYRYTERLTHNSKIGELRLPISMCKTPGIHEGSFLSRELEKSIPAIVDVLIAWNGAEHVVIRSWQEYAAAQRRKKKKVEMSKWADRFFFWMTGELLQIFPGLAEKLFKAEGLSALTAAQRHERVYIGGILFHFLFIQRELKEPMDVGGTTFEDFLNGHIVPGHHIEEAAAVIKVMREIQMKGEDETMDDHEKRFFTEHCGYDPHIHIPVYRRIGGKAPKYALIPAKGRQRHKRNLEEIISDGEREQSAKKARGQSRAKGRRGKAKR
ncbi:unnamed protein product, partial [Mycena citricolor]